MKTNGLGKRFLVITAASIFLAACATSETDTQTVTDTDTQTVTPAVPTPDVTQGTISSGPVPGSQAHLVATVGDRVFFQYDMAELTSVARDILRRQAEWLRNNPEISVIVEGHCDERGTREYNIALGDRRSTAARNYLIALGISSDRIRTISYGKERPVAFGAAESAWSKNRRAVMVVL
jgi:peptidoglycan-associated lipoprotein